MMIVNEKYIKEYEEMSLCDFADELVEPLNNVKKDLTKTIYIHYAEERDKNYKLEQENARLKEFKKEHEIMKKILIEKGLWETLLNDDRFLEYLREEN